MPLPDGWETKESLTLLAPDRQANVIVTREPIDANVTTAQYARSLTEQLRKKFPGYQELAFTATQFLDGQTGYMQRFEWKPSEAGESVTQIQIYYADQGYGITLHMGVAKAPVRNLPLLYTPCPCAVPIIHLPGISLPGFTSLHVAEWLHICG